MTPQQLRITRTFAAPIDLVWEAFSTAEHLAQWWGPKGFTTIVKTFEFTPGGRFHYGLQGGGGIMWGLFVYREIEEPTKIVFTNAFSNEAGEVMPAPEVPFGKHWPLEILNHLTFEDRGDTTVLHMVSYPLDASAETADTFNSNIANMQAGFGSTFDQLAARLETMKLPAKK